MEKIKIVVDSSSDIPDEELAELGIDMVCVPMVIDGQGYYERKSFSTKEFHQILQKASEIPTTSRVPTNDFLNSYQCAWEEGYTDLICVTINAAASGTSVSAHMARDEFYTLPDRERMGIHIVDSRSYSVAYGYFVMEAAKMAKQNSRTADILDYLENAFDSLEVYLGVYTLEYAKRSGRIGATTAFVGDVLGLRPIIAMIDGDTKIADRVRGETNMAPHLLKVYLKHRATPDAEVFLACGLDWEYGLALQQMIARETGITPPLYTAGASIVCNTGPRMLGVGFRGKKRSIPRA